MTIEQPPDALRYALELLSDTYKFVTDRMSSQGLEVPDSLIGAHQDALGALNADAIYPLHLRFVLATSQRILNSSILNVYERYKLEDALDELHAALE